MSAPLISHRLSRKLLVLTVLFILFAELIIFIPSAALFRQNWLADRAEAGGLLTLAIAGVPDYDGGVMLSKRFMADTDVTMVSQKRGGTSELVLGMPPGPAKIYRTDLRKEQRWLSLPETFRDFFGTPSGYLRILSKPTVAGADALELIVPRAALHRDLREYCHRVILWSLLISLLTGIMIYWALSRMIVQPIQSLATGLSLFRQDPRKRLSPQPKPSARYDEIGALEREFSDMKEGVRGALQQQERLATLGMAMAKINHDLRNVLTSAQLASDRLAMDDDERIAKIGARLMRAVQRGVNLCEATLSFSQSAQIRPKPESVRLASLAGEVAGDEMARHGRTTFVNSIDPAWTIYADPDQTYRMLQNLVRNAVQALAGRSDACISASAVMGSDSKIHITIADNGPGLPQAAKDNLFKAFTSAGKTGGTGLGLTIARELARANGGDISLGPTGPSGTQFLVRLPSA